VDLVNEITQLFRVLSRDEEASLRTSIQRFGILVPVILDADGALIDGHHRRRIGLELDRPIPEVRVQLRGDDAVAAARDLNLARRHLDKAERAGYAVQRMTSERPPSKSQVAKELGVDEKTVRNDLARSDYSEPERVKGKDGKSYPAKRPNKTPKVEPAGLLVEEPPMFEAELPAGFRVLCRDARDHFPDERADLAFTSPPYNVGRDYHDDISGDALPHAEWLDLLEWTVKVLVDGWQVGRLVINVPFGVDRNPYRFIAGDVVELLERFADVEGLGIWDKGGISNRTSWGSWRSPSAPMLRDRAEALIVARTAHVREPDGLVEVDGRRYSPLLGPDRFPILTQNVWQITPARQGPQYGIDHPAVFPVELAENVIRLWGWPGCHVVDPFAGTGTTGVAALRLGCTATLIDQSEKYCQLARRRLEEAK